MKIKLILTIFLVIFSIKLNAQSSFDNGFKNGFKNGYCYSNSQNNVYCNPPITPIPPLPQINESRDSYQDGYNRGFIYGQSRRNSDDNKSSSNNVRYNQQNLGGTQETLDYSVLYKGFQDKLAQQQQQYNQQKLLNSIQNKITENENIENNKRMTSLVKDYYNSVKTLPSRISDGWHNVFSTNNYLFCEQAKAYVSNNKVTKFVIQDWNEFKISYPSEINNAKTIINIVDDDNKNSSIIELYFIEYISNNNSSTSPPLGSGKISFWTRWKNSGNTEIYLDGLYAGKFTQYFKEGSPNCNQSGTLTVKYKPGTYSFKAISGLKKWEGTVTVTKDGCYLMELKK
jgi:hypothetical protein